MQKLTDEINRGLSRETHEDAIVKCFTTYVQDLPNGTGKRGIALIKLIVIQSHSRKYCLYFF